MIENEWFPKAVGLWRVQGGALALLSRNRRQRRVVKYSVMNPDPDGRDDGNDYCRDSGLVQASICGEYCYVESAEATR